MDKVKKVKKVKNGEQFKERTLSKEMARALYGRAAKHLRALRDNKSLFRKDAYDLMASDAYYTLGYKDKSKMFQALADECGVSSQVLSDAKICARVELELNLKQDLWSENALTELHIHTKPEDRLKMLPKILKLCTKMGKDLPTKDIVSEVKESYFASLQTGAVASQQPKAKRPVRKTKPNQDQSTLKARDDAKGGKSDSSKLPVKDAQKSDNRNVQKMTPALTEKAKHQESSSAQQPKAKLAVRPSKAAVAAARAKIKQGAKSSSAVTNTKKPSAGNVVSLDKDLKIDRCIKRIDNTFDDIKLKKFTNALEVYCDSEMQAVFDRVVSTPGFDDKDLMKIVGKLLKISKARKLDKSA